MAPDSAKSPLPEHPAAAGIRSTLLGIFVNALLAGIKGVAGILGNSYALIADAVESTSDIVTSLIVLGGLRFAQRPPDADHPYGHGKAEPLAALAVAIALITAAVGIAVLSVREILTPHHIPEMYTLYVLAGVVAVKEGLFRVVWRTGDQTGSGAVKADAWHHRSDAITSLAAAVGIGAAIWWQYAPADDWAALVAAAVIAANGMRLLKPALLEITDAAPPAELEGKVRGVAAGVPGVIGLDKCFLRKMGFDFYVDIHVVVDGSLSVKEGHEIAHRVKDALRAAMPRVADVLVHVEPAEQARLERVRKEQAGVQPPTSAAH